MFFAVFPYRLRSFAALLTLLMLSASLAACGATPSGSTNGDSTAGIPSSEAAYPRTMTDDAGESITISAAPQRIVALTPASVETLATLSLTDRVVGIAECTCTPDTLAAIPVVAGYEGVDLEQLIALEPDLVFVGGSGFTSADAITAMRTANLTVVTIDPKGVDGVYRTLRLIGDAVGASIPAAKLVASVRADIARLATLIPAGARPKVFYEIDATSTIYGLAPDDYAAELITLAGGEPVTSGSAGVYEIALETLVAAAPQVILLGDAAYGTTAAAVAARPGWSAIPAVAGGAIRPVDGDLVTTPGPRLAAALAALIVAINPAISVPAITTP
ncbi:MAG: hypothetical protein DWI45_04990 [Chloroflexi bacterium]|nr:MAG: hypothetical protein DWI45_04990 [Chloroflexota bacterium]